MTATFEIGSRYSATSACDSDCVWTFEVTARTAKFVTLVDVDNGDVMRVGVRAHDGVEWASPFGRYSMAPVISADRPVVVESSVDELVAERDRLVTLKAWGPRLDELERQIKDRTQRVELAQDAYYYGTAADLSGAR